MLHNIGNRGLGLEQWTSQWQPMPWRRFTQGILSYIMWQLPPLSWLILRGQKLAPSEEPNRIGFILISVDGSRAHFFNKNWNEKYMCYSTNLFPLNKFALKHTETDKNKFSTSSITYAAQDILCSLYADLGLLWCLALREDDAQHNCDTAVSWASIQQHSGRQLHRQT